MLNWFSGKNRRRISVVIVALLILAMVIPTCVSCVSGM